jgi:hypothetical protein
MSRTRIFVSYSRRDTTWLKRFREHASVLERAGFVEIWSDTTIAAGADWEGEIERALSSAKVAVLMVSPSFLASEYIWNKEMPRIVAHIEAGMEALPLIIRPCAWKLAPELVRLQARPTGGEPLSSGKESDVDGHLAAFTYELAAKIGRSPAALLPSSTGARERDAESDLTGEWIGYYNQNRPIRLVVNSRENGKFSGLMHYPAEGMTTRVEGTIHERWSATDPIWNQLGNRSDRAFGIAFVETAYETRGSSGISFDGQYRALVSGGEIAGAWFAGTRLVGAFTLRRS